MPEGVQVAQGYFRTTVDELRAGAQRFYGQSGDMRESSREPLAPATGGNAGFASLQAANAAADAWEMEVGELAEALRTAGDKLRDCAEEYQRAEDAATLSFERIAQSG